MSWGELAIIAPFAIAGGVILGLAVGIALGLLLQRIRKRR